MKRPSFSVQVFIGMAIGLSCGFWARQVGGGPLAETLRIVGEIFIQLLRVLVVPLVFTAIVASIAALRDLGNAARLVAGTLAWFAITALIAVTIGLLLGTIIQPGVRDGVDMAAAVRPATTGSWLDFLRGLVPSNLLGLSASTKADADGALQTGLSFNILQIIVIAIAIGIAAVRSGDAGAPFLAFNASLLAICRRILRWVVRLTPIGTAGLLGHAVVQYGWQSLAALGSFASAVYLGLGLVLLVVYPTLLKANGLSVGRFFAAAWPAIQLGFVSRSSIATLPVTEASVERIGVPRSYAAFAVPFAATTKMDGCAAIYPAIAALFVAQYHAIPLHATDYLLIVLVSVVGSAATAGLTGALVMLTLTLSTLGLPLEGAGLLLAIDPILDMGRTAVNVAGQALVPTLVAKRQGLIDQIAPVDAAAQPGPAAT
ncbi:cation:dicarboxylase symporter family transporter [Sphingomonas sp. KR1UV-12]|uniref:Cation:dicarboxylase symporter family transporter n=1 Tax=Sphingomonas aurea TaxID=3063994 RepID=A0ABT9EP05_9SPHN|nr:cation:dicarboxylase symporter family transporter [Sphingomonas sp. KR1UV-12]MDP1028513.1 cation:dicarboxylase symporter family transporter [Sphingomonas sp. KR1UV-12]